MLSLSPETFKDKLRTAAATKELNTDAMTDAAAARGGAGAPRPQKLQSQSGPAMHAEAQEPKAHVGRGEHWVDRLRQRAEDALKVLLHCECGRSETNVHMQSLQESGARVGAMIMRSVSPEKKHRDEQERRDREQQKRAREMIKQRQLEREAKAKEARDRRMDASRREWPAKPQRPQNDDGTFELDEDSKSVISRVLSGQETQVSD